MRRVEFKIGNMRKVVDWVVYPKSRTKNQDDPTLFVQSDKRALSINLKTKKGMLSNGKGHPGFHSTTAFCGAKEVDVPDEIIKLCTEAQPQSGDTIGSTPNGGIIRIA